jgi:hypothetical protein
MSLYHYTTGQKLPQILDSGYLIPSSAGCRVNEEPLLWFSKSKDYEPTALKMMVCPDGSFQTLTQEQQRSLVGNVRFLLKPDKVHVMPWLTACKTAGISTKDRKSLELVGRRQGGNPKNWFATLDYVPIELLLIEVETDNGWKPMEVSA